MKQHYVVIGSGSGGLTAAIGLVKAGFKVTIIEKHKIGGDCTHYGCVPSKSLLFEAHDVASLRHTLNNYVNSTNENNFPTAEVIKTVATQALEAVRKTRQEFAHEESPEWLNGLGITVVLGTATFIDNQTISVTSEHNETQTISFDKCVISTGSRPFVPPIKGLNDVPYLTNETIFDLDEIPEHLIILGNGPIGVEMAQAFLHLGSRVTLVGRSEAILERSDQEVAAILSKELQQEGLSLIAGNTTNISQNKQTKQIELVLDSPKAITGSHILVATGRIPNTNLNLEVAGVTYSKRGIEISSTCQTSNKNILAIGDCCDVPRFTHYAYKMGKTVVINAVIAQKIPLGNLLPKATYNKSILPAVTYTSPELAEAGLTQLAAEQKYQAKNVICYKLSLADIDRAKTHRHETGVIKIVTTGFWGIIVGVHILAPRAGEMLPEFQTMIQNKQSIRKLDSIIRAYPTYTANIDKLSREWLFNALKYFSKK